MYPVYSASMFIVVNCLLLTPLGPDHAGCASGNTLTDTARVSTLVEHRFYHKAKKEGLGAPRLLIKLPLITPTNEGKLSSLLELSS